MRMSQTSPTIATRIRGYGRRITSKMNMTQVDREQLRLANSPVAVLGPVQRRR